MKQAVLLVHGIGSLDAGWAEGAVRRLRDAAAQALRRLAGPQAPPVIDQVMEAETVYWQDILREREELLRQLLEQGSAWQASSVGAGGGLLRQLWGRLRSFEHRFVSDYIGDIIGYLHPETRLVIQQELVHALHRLGRRMPAADGKQPLTIVAHSLGSVIASEYVWDAVKQRAPLAGGGFHERFCFGNFFTVGSPLALFSLKFGGPEAFGKPVALEQPRGRWVNLYDPDDPVGMPLKPMNEAYAQAVLADVPVECGGYLFSHLQYFENPRMLEVVGRKLALDWAASARRWPEEKIREHYDNYDAWVAGLPA